MRWIRSCACISALLFSITSITSITAIAEPEVSDSDPRVVESASDGQLVRAPFSTRIEEREPTDPIEQLTTAFDHVFFFTELVGRQGEEILHRWEYAGELVAEVPLAILGPRWRVYSSKRLPSDATGTWTVTVVGSSGEVLAQRVLEYISAEPAAADIEQIADDLEP